MDKAILSGEDQGYANITHGLGNLIDTAESVLDGNALVAACSKVPMELEAAIE